MNDKEHDADDDTDGPHDQIGDPKEGVLSSHPRRRRQDHLLGAIKHDHRVSCHKHASRKTQKYRHPLHNKSEQGCFLNRGVLHSIV